MVRMKNILDRNILEFLNNLEGSPHEAIAFLTIADSLYGNTEADVSYYIACDEYVSFTLLNLLI